MVPKFKKKKHSFQVRRRALAIWQKLGFLPWRKPKADRTGGKKSGDFYKGAFDSIPFLNEDAKRTFVHLLLRPGYMIRDYIKGDHERYLAPLTSLIVFYAFFALVSAVMRPVQEPGRRAPFHVDMEAADVENESQTKVFNLFGSTMALMEKGWVYLHLDQYPDEVDTQHESSLAALESTLRSQGIPLFLSQFFFLWLAMAIALRRYKMGMSAYAAASAYILCQFSFFMLFALLASFGKDSSIGVLLMLLLLVWDYHQWLGTDFKKSLGRAVSTGVFYGLLYAAMILLLSGTAFLIANYKS
jgi:hypothetical protein